MDTGVHLYFLIVDFQIFPKLYNRKVQKKNVNSQPKHAYI